MTRKLLGRVQIGPRCWLEVQVGGDDAPITTKDILLLGRVLTWLGRACQVWRKRSGLPEDLS
jgi:hypothetical protein